MGEGEVEGGMGSLGDGDGILGWNIGDRVYCIGVIESGDFEERVWEDW